MKQATTNSPSKTRSWARSVAAGLALFCGAAEAELQGFHAEYSVKYLRMNAAEITLELKPLEDGSWYMHRRSRAVGVARWIAGDKLKIDEESWFEVEENQARPSRFLHKKPGAKRGRRSLEITFNDDSATLRNDKGQLKHFPISENSQDQVSAVVAVMLAMSERQKSFKMPIVGKSGEDSTSFKTRELGTLKTPAGNFKTLHLTQKTKKRTTEYWLALEHNMVPVKILHQEKGEEGAEMLLTKLK